MEELAVNSSFWAGRRVLVTGHTGFKGSWLCLWLTSMGARVTGYSLPPLDGPSMFSSVNLAGKINSLEGDVRDAGALASCVAKEAPEVVFHLAAQSLVRPSYLDPVGTYATNVMGTVHLLDAVRRQPGPVRALVNVTSDKCYENREWHWGYRECDPLGGFDPYSSSKAASEVVTAAFRSSFFSQGSSAAPSVAIATARAGNVIGGGDWAEDRLVPDIIRAFHKGEAVIVRNPLSIRPWQHVLEPLSGYLALAECLCGPGAANFADAWNFGPAEDDARSVEWIVEKLETAWGAGTHWVPEAGLQPHEARTLRLDTSKSRSLLGWRPRWNLELALTHVATWYRADERRQDMSDFSLGQIAKFEAAAS